MGGLSSSSSVLSVSVWFTCGAILLASLSLNVHWALWVLFSINLVVPSAFLVILLVSSPFAIRLQVSLIVRLLHVPLYWLPLCARRHAVIWYPPNSPLPMNQSNMFSLFWSFTNVTFLNSEAIPEWSFEKFKGKPIWAEWCLLLASIHVDSWLWPSHSKRHLESQHVKVGYLGIVRRLKENERKGLQKM